MHNKPGQHSTGANHSFAQLDNHPACRTHRPRPQGKQHGFAGPGGIKHGDEFGGAIGPANKADPAAWLGCPDRRFDPVAQICIGAHMRHRPRRMTRPGAGFVMIRRVADHMVKTASHHRWHCGNIGLDNTDPLMQAIHRRIIAGKCRGCRVNFNGSDLQRLKTMGDTQADPANTGAKVKHAPPPCCQAGGCQHRITANPVAGFRLGDLHLFIEQMIMRHHNIIGQRWHNGLLRVSHHRIRLHQSKSFLPPASAPGQPSADVERHQCPLPAPKYWHQTPRRECRHRAATPAQKTSAQDWLYVITLPLR